MTPGLLLVLALLDDAVFGTPFADPARLERAAALLQPPGREGTLGPWRLFTDAADRRLMTHLDRVAARLPETYRARFGLDAEARPADALVLFTRDASYRAFTSDMADLETLDTRGHAGGGIAAALAGITAEETRQTVVHELAHLLTQEVFAREAPPWIAEGLSEDLAWCRADAEGRLLTGSLDSVTAERKTGDRMVRVWSGSRATVKEFLERTRAGRGLPLSGLLESATRLFADAHTRRDAYTQAGLLVRFLLGGDPARAERFRVFLRAAALGAPTGLSGLAGAVGTDAKSLEKEYWTFVRRQ